MNGYQLTLVAFAASVIVTIACAIWAIIGSTDLRFKPLWIVGSLFGFIGLGINWTTPDDLVFLFGVMVPAVTGFSVLATGQIIVKVGFPIVAAAALVKIRSGKRTEVRPQGDI